MSGRRRPSGSVEKALRPGSSLRPGVRLALGAMKAADRKRIDPTVREPSVDGTGADEAS